MLLDSHRGHLPARCDHRLLEAVDPVLDMLPGEPPEIVEPDERLQLPHHPAGLVDGLRTGWFSPLSGTVFRPLSDEVVIVIRIVEPDRTQSGEDRPHLIVRLGIVRGRRRRDRPIEKPIDLTRGNGTAIDGVEDLLGGLVPLPPCIRVSSRGGMMDTATLVEYLLHRRRVAAQSRRSLRIIE